MLRLMHWILLLAPIGVFALALPLATRLGAESASAVFFYIALVSLLCVVLGLLLYPTAAVLGGLPIRLFARGCAQAQAVAATTRSSLASLPVMIEGAEKRLKLDPAVTRFFLPLSASMFRIGTVVGQTVGALFLARLYNVDIGTAELLTIAFTSVLTSFSVPAVAGGSIIVMVPVLVAAGIPVEGIGILLGVDAIPDIFRTTVNITGHMAGASIISRHVAPGTIPGGTAAAVA
jgi:Na+/H+-dicarboxylate symporter